MALSFVLVPLLLDLSGELITAQYWCGVALLIGLP
jgi:hypothetical protein